jgi:hypothetical protein
MAKGAEKKKVTKDVNVSRLRTPKNLTLTSHPANEVAFKIVRRDPNKPPHLTRQRPVRRMAPTLVLQFPSGATEEDVKSMMSDFGITDYKIEKTDDGLTVMRSDLKKIPETYAVIHLKDGVKALVQQGAVVASDDDPVPHIAVVGFEFDKAVFDSAEKVSEWLSRHEVDISESGIDNTGDKAVMLRQKVGPDIEVKRCHVDEGVEVVVARAAEQDVPPSVVAVVSELMYGSWGWGQLDFAAAMADIEFSEVAREATDVLYRVMENALFYSPLPLSVRKTLVNRALTQFGEFIGAVLDALPAEVLVTYRSDKEKSMTTKAPNAQAEAEAKAKAELKVRADAAREYLKANVENGAEAAKETDEKVIALAETARKELEKKPITRAEAEALVTAAVEKSQTATLAAVGTSVKDALKDIFAPKATEATRTDGAADGDKDKNKDTAPAGGAEFGKQIGEAIRSALDPVVKVVDEQGKAMVALTKTVEGIAGQTTVRSDGGDGKEGKEKDKDTFKGIFNRSAPAKAQQS